MDNGKYMNILLFKFIIRSYCFALSFVILD